MSAERPAPLTFYFDFISPYAYLGWTQIHALAERHGREVEPCAILFAALLDANATKGPAEIPSKRTYVFKDCVRSAAVLGVPFRPPPSHPFNPLLGLRVASAATAANDRRRAIDALYRAAWADGRGITDPAVVSDVLSAADLDGPGLVDRASSAEIKTRVKDQTARALEQGVFGVPTIIADGELFWGLDSLPHVERRLAGRDPWTPAISAAFIDLPASAQRPGSRRGA
jgi:2-hydroxychromene-2-carboxylate isomerase